jgi:hypothetical protein
MRVPGGRIRVKKDSRKLDPEMVIGHLAIPRRLVADLRRP